jgi:hypothetical protein
VDIHVQLRIAIFYVVVVGLGLGWFPRFDWWLLLSLGGVPRMVVIGTDSRGVV